MDSVKHQLDRLKFRNSSNRMFHHAELNRSHLLFSVSKILKKLSTDKSVNLEVRKRLVRCCVWSVILCGLKTMTYIIKAIHSMKVKCGFIDNVKDFIDDV